MGTNLDLTQAAKDACKARRKIESSGSQTVVQRFPHDRTDEVTLETHAESVKSTQSLEGEKKAIRRKQLAACYRTLAKLFVDPACGWRIYGNPTFFCTSTSSWQQRSSRVPGSFEGRQSKRRAPSAWKKRYDLKSFSVRRKPQDCIAENNGEQFSMKEEQACRRTTGLLQDLQVTWGPLGAILQFKHLPHTMEQSTLSRVWCSTGAKTKAAWQTSCPKQQRQVQ
ncbi:TPA: hypothetical protein ACH3X1_007924 [Trebouxia sp. C0004]